MRFVLLALAVLAAPPSASLTSGPPATVGQAWVTTVVARGTTASVVRVSASSGNRSVAVVAPRTSRGRYRLRLVFPAAGVWSLTARVAGRRLPLGRLSVREAEFHLTNAAQILVGGEGRLFVSEGGRHRVLRIDPSSGRTSIVATGFDNPWGLALLPDGQLLVTSRNTVQDVDPATGAKRQVGALPIGIEIGPVVLRDGAVFVASGDGRIQRLDLATGVFTVIADGLSGAHGLAFDLDGTLLIADSGNDRIVRLDLSRGTIAAAFEAVQAVGAIFLATDGSLYACEMDGRRVTRLDARGGRTTVAEGFQIPYGIQPAAQGGLYVMDAGSSTLSVVSSTGVVTRVRLLAPTP